MDTGGCTITSRPNIRLKNFFQKRVSTLKGNNYNYRNYTFPKVREIHTFLKSVMKMIFSISHYTTEWKCTHVKYWLLGILSHYVWWEICIVGSSGLKNKFEKASSRKCVMPSHKTTTLSFQRWCCCFVIYGT